MFPPNQWISELENELLGQRTDGPDLLHAGNGKKIYTEYSIGDIIRI